MVRIERDGAGGERERAREVGREQEVERVREEREGE